MAMTRKHYREVAEIIRAEREAAGFFTEDMMSAVLVSTFVMAGKLAVMFAHDNPYFDRGRFFEACGFDK